jgi:hypothetical protein
MTKLVHGVGINDADYVIDLRINGTRKRCKIYSTWNSMLRRCYAEEYQARKPTYKGCTVAPEWHRFSNFKAWHDQQNYTEGLQLDKDIIYPGNKVYSPETCVYVTNKLNNFLARKNGKYLAGAWKHPYNEGTKMFQSGIKIDGKRTSLGYYQTPEEAHEVYVQAKIKYIQDYYLPNETDQRIIDGLHRWIDVLQNGMYNLV